MRALLSFVGFVASVASLGCSRTLAPAPAPPAASSAAAREPGRLGANIEAGPIDAGVDATSVEAARPSSSLAKIVVQGADAFWFDGSGTLFVQKIEDGSKPAVLAHSKHEATALAIDATTAWFIDLDRSRAPLAAELVAVARTRGSARVVARFPYAETFVLSGDSAWVSVMPDRSIGAAEIQRVSSTSGAITRVEPTAPTTSALLADETSLFTANDKVMRIDKGSGTTKVLGWSPETAVDMAFVADEIVLLGVDAQTFTRNLWAYPKKGPPKTPPNVTLVYGGASPLSAEDEDVIAFASDGRRIFYTATPHGDGDAPMAKLRMVRRGKSNGPELAQVPSTSGIAAARGRIYWPTPAGLESIPLPP